MIFLLASLLTAAPAKVPLSMTVSGGVSLGAYEAGYVYYFTETLKRNRDRFKLVVTTGASAGSLNALLGAINYCEESQLDPTKTLLFHAWQDVGIDQLYVPEDTKPVALFSRRAMLPVLDNLAQRWAQGLPLDCDFVLGIATTRLLPHQLTIERGVLSLPRTEEKFVVRVQGRGAGKAPKVGNYVDPTFPIGEPLVPLEEGNFSPLRDLLLASAAFPFAFEPVPLRYCHAKGKPDATTECTADNAETDLFIDGGVFDNQPMRVAARAAARGLYQSNDGAWQWHDLPLTRDASVPAQMQLWSIDPHVTAYPALPEAAADPTHSYMSLILAFASSYLSTAETKTLYSLFERYPPLLHQVAVGMRFYPITSGLLGAFFGFFDKSVREFDFYLGMHDAHRLLELESADFRRLAADKGTLVLPETAAATHPRWKQFRCMHAVFDSEGAGAAAACQGEDMRDFRILLQVTLDRLYAQCAELPTKGITGSWHTHCERAIKGHAPPEVPDLHVQNRKWQRAKGEADFDYTLRLMGDAGFHFADLGLSRDDADRARAMVRAKLATIIARFAEVQPEAGQLLRLAGPPLLNTIAYQPPQHIGYFTLGPTIDAGWSMTNPASRWAWLRFAASLSADLGALAFVSAPVFSLTPQVGLEFEPTWWSTAAFQPRLGLRAGFSFSSADAFLARACDPTLRCSRLHTEAYFAVSLLDRVRLQLGVAWLPALRAGEQPLWAILPGAGVQFNHPL